MLRLKERPAWKALEAHAFEMREARIADLFTNDPARAQEFSVAACGLLFDYSKNPLSRQTRRLLVTLA